MPRRQSIRQASLVALRFAGLSLAGSQETESDNASGPLVGAHSTEAGVTAPPRRS